MKQYFIIFIVVSLMLGACKRKPIIQTSPPQATFKTEKIVINDTVLNENNLPIEIEKPIPINPRKYYWQAFREIKTMLGTNELNFKNAVFMTENAWFEDSLNYKLFDTEIQRLATTVKHISKSKNIIYDEADYESVNLNASIFKVITDTTILIDNQVFISTPYRYDFEDFTGSKNWSSMFILKLLASHKGNCHSMPFLYKILALELNAKAWLSFAPHHIYIKSKCKKTGMYNTELTSGEFPTDAWIACSGYISTEAIQSGIYMDTLSLKQSVAFTLYDLAKGYQRKFGIEDGEFMLTCLNESLNYFPNCINALLLKASTLTDLVHKNKLAQSSKEYQEMEQTYKLINQLGYNEMPEQNYQEWLRKLQTAKADNKEINSIFKPKSK